jgi:uncharacterized protein YcaQ
VHPRQVDEHFALGRVTNYWGGSSSATTHLLDTMHYRGMLRVVGREAGVRIYGLHRQESAPAADTPVHPRDRRGRLDALVDVVVNLYAPLPAASLTHAVGRLRYAVPQWSNEITAALQRARKRLSHARVAGVDWYWPSDEQPGAALEEGADDAVRLLAPFDPVVWDRRRFELLWNWPYRFEAYTPVTKRRWGYYALPMLWRDHVIGWANATFKEEALQLDVGYVAGKPPRERRFRQALADERARLSAFLGVPSAETETAHRN